MDKSKIGVAGSKILKRTSQLAIHNSDFPKLACIIIGFTSGTQPQTILTWINKPITFLPLLAQYTQFNQFEQNCAIGYNLLY